MSGKLNVRLAVVAAFLAASGMSNVALAVYEVEPNDDINASQRITVTKDGTAEITGALGNLTGPIVADLDFYSFEASAGDVLTIDIDGGMKASGSGVRSVDTYLAIFGPGPAFEKLRENDDIDRGVTLDAGSLSRFDALIQNFHVDKTGVYTVAVSSFPRTLRSGGVLDNTTLNANSNGSYTLLISGVTPPVQQINIEVKPGRNERAPVNPNAKGSLPVVLLSSAEFNPLEVDQESLTFGAVGNEPSLLRCNKEGPDVNGDGRPDLLCHFDNQVTGFEQGDLEGIVMGRTTAGKQFEGHGPIKTVPGKR